MAIPARTVHRPSIALLTIAGAMFAVAHATAHEMRGQPPICRCERPESQLLRSRFERKPGSRQPPARHGLSTGRTR